MNKKIFLFIAFFGVVIVVSIFFCQDHLSKTNPSSYVEETKRRSGVCPGTQKVITAEGVQYTLTENWYACNAIKRGDLVLYRFSFSKPPIARRVLAAPGDIFSVLKDEDDLGWKLKVNANLAINSQNNVYIFGNVEHDPLLKLYIQNGEGKLSDGQAIIFSEPKAGVLDSGIFGVVNADDFLGKLDLPTIQNAHP